MSEKKLSVLDKRLAKFAESTTELLTDIHARNKGENRGKSNKLDLIKKRRMKKPVSTPAPDKEPSGS